jgi:hypothetical protein
MVDARKLIGEIVAEEKAGRIKHQRRSIRALGKVALYRMILYIFENIGHSEYQDITVANTFGLSEATFSRFAGSQWNPSNSFIPDLWLNTAQVLAVHPDFKETALEAGVWEQVYKTLNKAGERKEENEQ